MVSSEFGRTPKINATAGRDHWPKVFSVMLAGGGIKGGTKELMSPGDRPIEICDGGKLVKGLLA
jgi:uncharacterized protein (DUF1501 family)